MAAFIAVTIPRLGQVTLAAHGIDAFYDRQDQLLVHVRDGRVLTVSDITADQLADLVRIQLGTRLLHLGGRYFVADGVTGIEVVAESLRVRTRGNSLVPMLPATQHDFEIAINAALTSSAAA